MRDAIYFQDQCVFSDCVLTIFNNNNTTICFTIAEVPIRFRPTWELYASIMDDFAVYMQDNKKLDFVIINEDNFPLMMH